MFDVLILFVERIEKNETTIINWLNWDEEIKMIIEFNSKICFSSKFRLIQRLIILLICLRFSWKMILRVFSWFRWQTKHDKKSRWNATFDKCDFFRILRARSKMILRSIFFSFRDRFTFHNVIDCFDSTKMNEKEFFFSCQFRKKIIDLSIIEERFRK